MNATKVKGKRANSIIDEKYQLFSNVDNLLKYRDQTVSDSHHHGSELFNVVKYYTTIISALFSLEISILLASFRLFYDDFLLIHPLIYLILVPIPVIVILLSNIALDNSKRKYRNTMEYLSIRMKIDEMLGTYNPVIYSELREKFQLKFFNPDLVFANARWSKEYDALWQNKSSEEFVKEKIENKNSAYGQYSRFFRLFKYIAYCFFAIPFVLIVTRFFYM